jgi:hypothetical protein
MKNKEGLESNFNVTFFEVREILKKFEPFLPLKKFATM